MPSITPIEPLDRFSSTFRADCNAFLGAKLPTLSLEMEAVRVEVSAKEASATAAAAAVAINAANAAASAALAGTYAGSSAFVPGAARTISDKRWSLTNGFTYRATTTGAGSATDPVNDQTNWELYSTAIPVQLVTGLTQLMVSGAAYCATYNTPEGASTNECLWSNDASNAVWVKTGYTVSPNVAMDPDGNMTADKLVESATNVIHYENQTFARAANVPLTYSRRIKADGRSTFAVLLDDGSWTNGLLCTFNLTTGAVTQSNAGTATGAAASLVFLGDGWFEMKVSGTPATSGTSVRAITYINGQAAYLGNGVSGLLVTDAKLETGTVATSRILTGATAVTRAAGVVPPTRFILPANPTANAFGRMLLGNGISTNVVDPNGQTIEGLPGPMCLDLGPQDLQFVNGTWKRVNK